MISINSDMFVPGYYLFWDRTNDVKKIVNIETKYEFEHEVIDHSGFIISPLTKFYSLEVKATITDLDPKQLLNKATTQPTPSLPKDDRGNCGIGIKRPNIVS